MSDMHGIVALLFFSNEVYQGEDKVFIFYKKKKKKKGMLNVS